MATTKQQKMIDFMFCRVDKEEKLLVVAQEVQAFLNLGDTITYSKEGNNTPHLSKDLLEGHEN
jgi:hypothetical protein